MNVAKKLTGLLKRETSTGKYIPLIDGIRFLAIMLVLMQHLNERIIKYNSDLSLNSGFEEQFSFLLSRGSVGVFIFFTLSGFIISLPFFKNSRQENFNYRKYIVRRITRLEPTYILWMSFFMIVFSIKSGWGQGIFGHFFSSIFYIHNIVYTDLSIINPVSWSLEVEIQYYLIAPFLVFGYLYVRGIKRRRFLILILIGIFICVQNICAWQLIPFKLSLLGHLQHFLTGIFIADLYSRGNFFERKSYFWDIVFIPSLLLIQYTWSEELIRSLIMETALIFLFISVFKGKWFRLLFSNKITTIIGGMCYTIYLIHLPLFEGFYTFIFSIHKSENYFLNLILSGIPVLLILLLISIPAYYYLEKPFMKNQWWMSRTIQKSQL
ncbi:acyltransferase [Hyphobacterium sp. CCMP332]|nr:acyltransferase [Hyphobacterium sp. CCMP332]